MDNEIKYNVKTIIKLAPKNIGEIKKAFNEKLLSLILSFENR